MKTYDELKVLIDQFESIVSNAWIYDTKLEFKDEYNPSMLKKADKLFEELKNKKEEVLAALKENFSDS